MLEKMFRKRGEVEGGDLTFVAWSSMVSDDMCDESCSTIFDE